MNVKLNLLKFKTFLISLILVIIFSFIILCYFNRTDKSINNTQNFLVSILLPAYNVEEYIDECLNNIINQTYNNIEIIIVDDYSTDNTRELIEEYVKRDNRIKFLKHTKNLGLPYARNTALKEAKGEYLYFMDSDDFIDKNLINSFVDSVKKTNADVVVNNNIYYYYSNNKHNKLLAKKFNKKHFIHNKEYKGVIHCNIFGYYVWNKFVKASLMKENNIFFKEDIVFGEDQVFSFKILSSAKKIVWNNKKNFYYYRRRNNSLTSKHFATNIIRLENIIKVIYEQYEYVKRNNYGHKSEININNAIFYLKNIMFLYKEDCVNKAYNKVRQLFISIQDIILENQNIYSKYTIDYFNAIIKCENLISFVKWRKNYKYEYKPLKWYDNLLYNIRLIVYNFL